jgi:hypothetical protein
MDGLMGMRSIVKHLHTQFGCSENYSSTSGPVSAVVDFEVDVLKLQLRLEQHKTCSVRFSRALGLIT